MEQYTTSTIDTPTSDSDGLFEIFANKTIFKANVSKYINNI